MKICTKCKIEKSEDMFCRHKKNRDGLNTQCKECAKKLRILNAEKYKLTRQKYRKENREKELRAMKRYYENNKEELLEDNRRRYKNNKEEILLTNKKYREKNKDIINEKNKRYYHNNKEKVKEYKKYWYNKNKKSIREKDKVRRQKYKNNPEYMLLRRLRTRVHHALVGLTKSAKTIELLGCDIDAFRKYFESKFLVGMTFDNYGKWHIDHIKPCASFDLSNPEEQRKCFHYTNLQPMWAEENMKKSSTYMGKYYRGSSALL